MCLKRHEIWDDDSVLWNVDLLVSDLKETRLIASVFRDTREGIVQSEGLELEYELVST